MGDVVLYFVVPIMTIVIFSVGFLAGKRSRKIPIDGYVEIDESNPRIVYKLDLRVEPEALRDQGRAVLLVRNVRNATKESDQENLMNE